MRIVIDRRFLARAFGPAYGVLVIAAIGLSLLTPLPLVVGVTLAVAGATLASLLRVLLPRRLRFLGLFPALVALGVFVADSPVGTIPELAGGVGGLALLLWCAEDPDRYPGDSSGVSPAWPSLRRSSGSRWPVRSSSRPGWDRWGSQRGCLPSPWWPSPSSSERRGRSTGTRRQPHSRRRGDGDGAGNAVPGYRRRVPLDSTRTGRPQRMT